MAWLHTWAGVVIGSLLFIIFWMGSLSVFDREIDRWMMPDTRFHAPETIQLDGIADDITALAPGSPQWGITLPTERAPMGRIFYQDTSGTFQRKYANLETGTFIPDQGTRAGTGFLYPFHYSLHIRWKGVGYWLVGLAALAMMALLVTGVIIHSRIFIDFFTFRPKKKLPRSTLDLHNLSGVLFLPFHFMIAFSGLVIFMNIYFPQGPNLAYGDTDVPRSEFFADIYGRYSRDKAEAPGPEDTASLDAMLAQSEAAWDDTPASFVRVWHPGDANSYFEVRRSGARTVHYPRQVFYYDLASGDIINEYSDSSPAVHTQRFLSGMHFILYDHWVLRWFYFVAGIAGCVLIATGFVYWMETRRKKHEKMGLKGVRIVHGLTIGSVTGILVATLAFFVINRLLPLNTEFLGLSRAALEIAVFYLVWVATFAHAFFRPSRAWLEQTWVIAGLSVLAFVLNGLTTGDHLFRSISEGLWAVAGMDLMLLFSAVVAALMARRLQKKQTSEPVPIKQAAAAPSPAPRVPKPEVAHG
ncbi:MAG: PepSY-associated TM helix domain-containing protein [Bacteroidota bacterium]